MKLFQSIFGGATRGRYPESLIELATERAVDGTDSRLRLVSGYRKRLREPIIRAIDHVVALVDDLPEPLEASARQHGEDRRLTAVFASAGEMLDLLAHDRALIDWLADPANQGVGQVTALLRAERRERNILGMDLVGDQMRRDVPQVSVSFEAHRLLDPAADPDLHRRQLKRRAFDHLLTLALTRIAEAREERADLVRQRDLLKRKLTAFRNGGWNLDPLQAEATDPIVLQAELEAIAVQLNALGIDQSLLNAHLGMLAEVLDEADRQLQVERLVLHLDPMNIRRPEGDPAARRIELVELSNARGQRAIMLPLRIAPAELPARRDFLAAAERYL